MYRYLLNMIFFVPLAFVLSVVVLAFFSLICTNLY